MERCVDDTDPTPILPMSTDHCLLKHSQKMQKEHVTNAEKILNLNRNELLKKWHKKPKEQKVMPKCTENIATSGITIRE